MTNKNFTQKTNEALQAAQRIAVEHGNPQIEQFHLLYALLDQENGLIPQLITAIGPDPASLKAAVNSEMARMPRVSGSGREPGKVYISADMDKAINAADRAADQMKDEYLSVEHLFLGLLDAASPALKKLFQTYGIDREKVLAALSSVRGSQRVTSDTQKRPMTL